MSKIDFRRIDTTNWQSFVLAILLFVLSIKGSRTISIGNDFEYTIMMPNFLAKLKEYVYIISAILIFLFICFASRSDKRVKYTAPLVIYVVVITYYFLLSYFLNGQIENLIAILIIQIITPAFLKYQNGSNYSSNFPKLLFAFNVFSILFVLLNFLLFLFGYGYPDFGQTRYFGAAYHPNSLGAISAIVFGVFISQMAINATPKIPKIFLYTFLFVVIFISIISGSRGSVLMMGVAFLAFSRSAKSFIFSIIFISIFYFLTVFIVGENSSTYSAIDRIVNTQSSNRGEVWMLLFNDFINNPLFGVGDTTAVSGSIYLTALAGTGLFGGSAFIAVCLVTAKRAFFYVTNKISGEIDLSKFISSIVVLQILVGGFFEATVFDRLSPVSLIMLFCVAIVNMKVLKGGC